MAQVEDQAQKRQIAMPRRVLYNPRDIWTPIKKRGRYRPEVQVEDGEEASRVQESAIADSQEDGRVEGEGGSDPGIQQPQGIAKSQESQPAAKARKRKVKP